MASNQFVRSRNAVPLQAGKKSTSAPEPCISVSQLGGDFQPSEYSVICGRGKESFNFVGNCHFRTLTTCYLERYSRAVTKAVKSAIVSDIVTIIRQAGGNFCKYEKGAWFEVGDRYAREKVSTLLRDLPCTQYIASAKAKIARRRAQTKLNKKQNQQYGLQLVQCTGHSDDSSTVSSSCWGSSMDSLGGQYLPDDVFFDIEYVF
jgi:hypothetical protein